MTHKFKDEIIDWLNGGEYEFKKDTWIEFSKITELQNFIVADDVRKVDQYKHLREALERGETIQFMGRYDRDWLTLKSPANFNHPASWYRIKPKTKKMVQWLLKDLHSCKYFASLDYYDVGVTPDIGQTEAIKSLPHTEIEVEE